jgi:hypothetical protein
MAVLALAGIVAHLALRWGSDASPAARDLTLYARIMSVMRDS